MRPAAEKVAASVARGAYKSVKDGSKHRGVCGETKTDDEGNCSATGPQPHKGSWEVVGAEQPHEGADTKELPASLPLLCRLPFHLLLEAPFAQ